MGFLVAFDEFGFILAMRCLGSQVYLAGVVGGSDPLSHQSVTPAESEEHIP